MEKAKEGRKWQALMEERMRNAGEKNRKRKRNRELSTDLPRSAMGLCADKALLR